MVVSQTKSENSPLGYELEAFTAFYFCRIHRLFYLKILFTTEFHSNFLAAQFCLFFSHAVSMVSLFAPFFFFFFVFLVTKDQYVHVTSIQSVSISLN